MDKQKTRKRLDRCRAISDACADGVNMAIKLTFISATACVTAFVAGFACIADYISSFKRGNQN